MIQTLWKMVWRFLKKLAIKSPYDPAIPPLGIYPEETKIERDTYIPLFITALFTIARTWKQPTCPSTDEGIKKVWYVYTHTHTHTHTHTMEYCAVLSHSVMSDFLQPHGL